MGRCLEEDPQRLPPRLRNQVRIGVAAFHLDEAAEEARDTAEPVGAQPGRGERAVPAAAAAHDRPLLGIIRDREALLNVREDLGQQERRVVVVESVVLGVAVVRLTGIDEHTDRDRQLASMNQVVHHHPGAERAVGIEVELPVLEHDQRRRVDRRRTAAGTWTQ